MNFVNSEDLEPSPAVLLSARGCPLDQYRPWPWMSPCQQKNDTNRASNFSFTLHWVSLNSVESRCYCTNPTAPRSYICAKLLWELVIHMPSTLRPKSLLSHQFVRGTCSPLQKGTVYSVSSYNIWQAWFNLLHCLGFIPWMLTQYYAKYFPEPAALSQWQMLAAAKLSGTVGVLNLGLMSIRDSFSRSKRIMSMLINQLATVLEITMLRS